MEKLWQLRLLALSTSFFALTAHASIFEGELASPSSIHSLLTPAKDITVELGIEYMHPSLPTIRNIIVENGTTSTAVKNPREGDVQSTYPDTVAQTLKFQALLNNEKRWTIAIKTYLPLDGIAQVDTGNEYQPELVLYRAEAQRPRILLTSGIDLGPEWRIAAGLDVAFSVSAQAIVFLQSGPGTVSDQRISAKVKPGFVPQASLAYRQYQFTVRAENKADFDLSTVAGARVFSDVSAGLDFNYVSSSALFYQPWQFEFTGINDLSSVVAIKWGVSYELWSGFKTRAAVIRTDVPVNCTNSNSCTPQFSSGANPDFSARNIFVPEIGLKFTLGDDVIETDYQFKDSIFKSTPSGTGNYLDPPRHDFKVGFTHPTLSGWEWNIHATVSRLSSQTVVKSDPTSIGGPGYSVDGWLYGGGFSVAIPFKD